MSGCPIRLSLQLSHGNDVAGQVHGSDFGIVRVCQFNDLGEGFFWRSGPPAVPYFGMNPVRHALPTKFAH